MARVAFFSYHYDRDIWRVNIVRNGWIAHADRDTAGYYDGSLWEEAKRKGDGAIQRLIDEGLNGCSVTSVLLGAQTDGRKWVDYEIEESHKAGMGLLAIRIHGLRDAHGRTDVAGSNPFDRWRVNHSDGKHTYFNQLYRTYDYVVGDGYNNIGDWIELAAREAGR